MKMRALLLAACAATLGVSSVASAAYFFEDFEGIADTTEIITVPGWSRATPDKASWVVDSTVGYAGNGLRLTSTDATFRTLTGSEVATDPASFFVAQVMPTPGTEHRYFNPFIWISGPGASGGTYGVGIRFNGGSTQPAAGQPAGSILMMSGGSSWADASHTAIPGVASSGWKTGTWYTVRIDNIGSGPLLSVFETDNTANVVLDGVAIAKFGTGTFSSINTIGMRESSTVRNTRYDNLMLTVPEPASVGLIALVGGALLGRRREA